MENNYKFTGSAKKIGKEQQGIEIILCVDDLKAGLKSDDTQDAKWRSEKNGKRYCKLVAWPSDKLQGEATHSLRFYTKSEPKEAKNDDWDW